MQGRANLLQTEFNRAFQPGSQTEAFFYIEKDNDPDLNTKIDGWNTVQIVPILEILRVIFLSLRKTFDIISVAQPLRQCHPKI